MEAENDSIPARYTAIEHVAASDLKPCALIELRRGALGPEAHIGFTGGFCRWMHIDRVSAWHPLFATLPGGDQIRLRQYCHEKQPQDDGTLRVIIGPLSFVTERCTPRGKWLGTSCFDLPDEEDHTGRVSGIKAAAEMLALVRNRPDDRMVKGCLRDSLAEAGTLVDGPPHRNDSTRSRRGAAVAYIEVMVEFLTYAAKYSDVERFISARLKSEQSNADWWSRYKADQRAEFLANMAAARAKKRAEAPTQLAA